jgi:hypothetical protein
VQDLDQLHRRYGERLVQSMTGLVRDRERAEDIAARAFETGRPSGEIRSNQSGSRPLPATKHGDLTARSELPDSIRSTGRKPADSPRLVDGLSIREIARHERVPLRTLLSRIFKGKQLLREAWAAPIPVV